MVDIQDEEQFTPPIRLHRRDPRAPPSGAGSHFEEEDCKEDLEEIKERERLDMVKEERRKIRVENQAKIAPTGIKKPPAFQKKTEQKFRPDDTPEAEKRRLLKYEETLPWHLEDFDNKQTWVGVYESELSESHVMLTTAFQNGQDVIQMVPLERWYKFSVKSKVKQAALNEGDDLVKSEGKVPMFLSNIEKISIKREQEHAMRGNRRMRTRIGDGDEEAARRGAMGDDVPFIKREADADDIDYNMEEDFADDEEGLNGLFEGEELDVKEAAERVKRDHLAAAAFDLRNEEEIYAQELREQKAAEGAKALEKKMRKALAKREKNPDYWSSDNENPYEDESEDDSDEEEERKAKEEEERKAAENNGKEEADKLASGTSTKGSNTPSGSHKPIDINNKKRPGSPNLSEASGNESARKKHKKKHEKGGDGLRKSHLNEISKRTATSGSDSEMTDTGRSKKQKLKVRLGGGGGSPSGSPSASRAGSPAASQLNGSRAGSPAGPGGAAASQCKLLLREVEKSHHANPQTAKPLPTANEIYKAIPADGMTITQLIEIFRGRVDKKTTPAFIRLVKVVSAFDKARSWLTPLPQMPSEDQIQAALRGTRPAPKSAAASPS
jgi:transcription initiation factor TFIIF subunit alpha